MILITTQKIFGISNIFKEYNKILQDPEVRSFSPQLKDVITHDFEMIFKIGGSSGSPRVEVKMPQCHVEVPTHSIEDVISLESSFTSLQSDMESNIVDDLEVSIYGVALA